MIEQKVSVLHVASFEGNIGDNANHNGTYRLFKKNLPFALFFEKLEIREFFWKKLFFDEDFAAKANQNDLVLIGGGNFFELWVESSCNSTSIDIRTKILEKINVPIIFYGLGVDAAQGIANIDKFKTWLDYIISKPEKYILSCRNDGALETLEKKLGNHYAKQFHKVPDGGFFISTKNYFHPEIPKNKTVIGINLAGDMPETRFPDKIGQISEGIFLSDFAEMCNEILDEDSDKHLIFFSHIYKDYYFLVKLIKNINDWHLRRRITVAPYLHGEGSEEYLFSLYQSCDLILGNRFHANVCAIGLGIPSIGLVNYTQIENLYKELNIPGRCIKINKSFKSELKQLIQESIYRKKEINAQYLVLHKKMRLEADKFHNFIGRWLLKNLKKE